MTDIQSVIQKTLDNLVDSGNEEGLQAAVYLDGELVADCVAGVDGQNSDTSVRPDTLFTIFSASKGIVSTAFHMLVERGLFDYAKPVAHYWPEFAAAGKEEITIAQVMNHTAGIPRAATSFFITATARAHSATRAMAAAWGWPTPISSSAWVSPKRS